ncbi:MAG: DegT/DnrJ/EryC1/StrS family aminotransferase [Leptospirales bacterium]|nr:DegT/DnrJ/EryC1/StrS family aminotransferase [Leptospirales bacterium]
MNDLFITVTSPLLPPLEEFIPYLEDIWKRKWITNNGFYHQELEKALCEYLKVPYISLFTNGTLPLMVALQLLEISGEVITTPYSFVATTHALWWNGIKPVFVDIEEKTGNLDPNKIESAITSRTTAIMPVHVYGNPCNNEAIQQIAHKYDLKVIYDAAHAFGVEKDGISILNAGDLSTLSFHATKTYNTIEGGALICHDETTKKQIDYLKNFGFAGETEVVMPGINGKLDEIRSAYGLLNLKYVEDAIVKRQKTAKLYREKLINIPGITILDEISNIKSNHSYFPVFVDKDKYGINRDELYEKLKARNIFGRRYFYPLISTFFPYNDLDSAKPENLPVATKMADRVICLPMHHELSEKKLLDVTTLIKKW